MTLPVDWVRSHHDNVGLALSKNVPTLVGKDYAEFVRSVLARARPHADYEAWFRRWQRRTPPDPTLRRVLRLRAEAPVLLGMGEPVPGENGLTHHFAYGVPMLPGSSLKGVVRAWCASRFPQDHPWGLGGDSFSYLFGKEASAGDGGEAGAVDFFDALPERPSWVAEILTPHHADYYKGRGDPPPQGLEGPNPVTFLGATGVWRLVLEGPPAWLDATTGLLERALLDLGLGAKTRAGYGRLTLLPLDAQDQRTLEALEEQRFDTMPFQQQLAFLLRRNNESAVEQSLRSWALGREPQLSLVSRMAPTPERQQAAAIWLEQRGLVQRLRRQKDDEAAQALLSRLLSWLPDQSPEPTSAQGPALSPGSAPEPTPALPRFGTLPFTPPSLPPSEPKRSKALNHLSERLCQGDLSEAGVRAGVDFLRASGAREGTINRVIRHFALSGVE